MDSLNSNPYFSRQQQPNEAPRNTQKYKIIIKLYELVSRYPKVHILWSKSAKNSTEILK